MLTKQESKFRIGVDINKEMLGEIKAAMINGWGSVFTPAEVRSIVKGGRK